MPIGRPGASYRGYAGIGIETTYGEGVAPQVYTDIMSDGFESENNIQHEETIRGRGRHKSVGGAFNDEGEVELNVSPENGFGYFLKGVLGGETVTPDPAASPQFATHRFTPTDFIPSFSVELGLGDITPVRHSGVGVDSLEIEHSAEEFLSASAELPASAPDSSVARATPAYSDLRTFAYFDAAFSIDGTDRTVDVSEISISVENNIEKLYRDSRGVSKMHVGERPVTIEATLDFENTDLMERMFGGPGATSPQQGLWTGTMDGSWTSPETVGTSVEPYAFGFDAPAVQMDTHGAQLNERDLIAEEVTFELLYDGVAGYDIAFDLTNSRMNAYEAAP